MGRDVMVRSQMWTVLKLSASCCHQTYSMVPHPLNQPQGRSAGQIYIQLPNYAISFFFYVDGQVAMERNGKYQIKTHASCFENCNLKPQAMSIYDKVEISCSHHISQRQSNTPLSSESCDILSYLRERKQPFMPGQVDRWVSLYISIEEIL